MKWRNPLDIYLLTTDSIHRQINRCWMISLVRDTFVRVSQILEARGKEGNGLFSWKRKDNCLLRSPCSLLVAYYFYLVWSKACWVVLQNYMQGVPHYKTIPDRKCTPLPSIKYADTLNARLPTVLTSSWFFKRQNKVELFTARRTKREIISRGEISHRKRTNC